MGFLIVGFILLVIVGIFSALGLDIPPIVTAIGASVSTALIFVGVIRLDKKKRIEPMDVYQGHTILEYKVVGGKVVDSTVVWTPEYKKEN